MSLVSSPRLLVTSKILLPRGFHWEAKKQLVEQQKEHLKGFDSRGMNLEEALAELRKQAAKGFDEILQVTFGTTQKDGVPIKGRIVLPHGMGRKARVVVFTNANRVKEALDAGAFEAGDRNLVDQIAHGHSVALYESAIATPDLEPELAKIKDFLGTRGLYPSQKMGTMTEDLATAVKLHTDSFRFKTTLAREIQGPIGKLSFTDAQLKENLMAFMKFVKDKRPPHPSNAPRLFTSISLSTKYSPSLYLRLTQFPESTLPPEELEEEAKPREWKKWRPEVKEATA